MKPRLRLATVVVLALAIAAAGAGVSIAQPKSAVAVQARQANFKQLGGGFKAINDELKKDAPDPAVLRVNSAKVSALAGQLPRWFAKGTGPEAGVKTGAKPDIWTDPKAFADAGKTVQAQAAKLAALSAGADLGAFRAQVRATGGACKGCHDKFRLEEKR